MSAWYAVLCKPRREMVAEANLINQNYEVYLPRLIAQRRREGRWVDVVEALFPRYLFLALRSEKQSLAAVRSTLGVSDLVRFGGQPAIVREEVIECLRQGERSARDPLVRHSPFRPGCRVELRDGPLKGLTGVFSVESADERVFVLLEFLGKTSRIRVHRDWVVPAA